MIKYFCDRCDREADRLFTTEVPQDHATFGDVKRKTELCNYCIRELNEWLNALAKLGPGPHAFDDRATRP